MTFIEVVAPKRAVWFVWVLKRTISEFKNGSSRHTADVSNHLVRRLFRNITLDVHYSVCSGNKILWFECVPV